MEFAVSGMAIARKAGSPYHTHRRDGADVFVHRHDGDAGDHEHHVYAWEDGRPGRTLTTDGHRTPGEVTPLEDLEDSL
jgi:hypothetical protein